MPTIRVIGLLDGQHTGSTAHLLRQIKALGATATVAKTGRVTLITSTGERRSYKLEMAPGYRDFTPTELAAADSPLHRALRDLQGS